MMPTQLPSISIEKLTERELFAQYLESMISTDVDQVNVRDFHSSGLSDRDHLDEALTAVIERALRDEDLTNDLQDSYTYIWTMMSNIQGLIDGFENFVAVGGNTLEREANI